MRLGQTLYFVGINRPSGPDASVTVRSGVLIAVYNGMVTVQSQGSGDAPDTLFLSLAEVYFDSALADQMALGMGCRFLLAFKYERVTVRLSPSNPTGVLVLCEAGLIRSVPNGPAKV